MGRIKRRPTKVVYTKLDEVMEFSMHKGLTIGEILDKDPACIKLYWTGTKPISGFDLQGEVLDKFREIYPDVPKADPS